jgi:hypothetical protein
MRRMPFSRNSIRRLSMALQQEVGVLLAVVLVHAAAGVAAGLVALVEGVVLLDELERTPRDAGGVGRPGAALAAVGAEVGDRDAHRHAGAAAVAVGAVGEDAAAPEAVADELAVDGVSIRWLGVATWERACRSGR